MWVPSKTLLESCNKGSIFLIQSWLELFDSETPASFRVRLHDPVGLLEELQEIASQSIKDERWGYNIPHIVKEFDAISSSNQIMKDDFSYILRTVKTLDASRDYKNIAATSKIFLQDLSVYKDRLRARLLDSSMKLPREKENTLAALRLYATRVLADGIHKSQCVDFDYSLIATTKTPKDIVEFLVESTTPQKEEWFFIASIKGSENICRPIVSKSNFSMLSPSEKPLGVTGREYTTATQGYYRICQKVQAEGPYQAASMAVEELQRLIDLVNFHYHATEIVVHNKVYVSKERDQFIIDFHDDLKSNIQPQSSAMQRVSDLLSRVNSTDIPSQLTTALEQYNIANNSKDIKVRFLNMWIALETLIGRSSNSSIIDRICQAVPYIVVSKKINRVLKYFAISLHKFGYCSDVPDETGCFELSDERSVRRDELLLVLSGRRGRDPKIKLCCSIKKHPILLYHLYRFNKTIEDPKSCKNELSRSISRCEWQLRRIYRARNLLVHAGHRTLRLPYLLENLQLYFTTAVQFAIAGLVRYPALSIHEVFVRQRIMLQFLLSQMECESKAICLGQILMEGGPYKDEKIWG